MADDDSVVVTLFPLEPRILTCAECESARWHIYDDSSMVCANKKCGMRTRVELFGDDE